MKYACLKNGRVVAYPYTISQLRADNQQTSFPKEMPLSTLAEWGVVEVSDTTPPILLPTEKLDGPKVIYQGGAWVEAWTVVPLTAEELTAKRMAALGDLRVERNKRLKDSDFSQLKDAPLTPEKTAEWALYRQQLRDITKVADPLNPIWPPLPA